MAIYPRCGHLKVSMIASSLLGIFPWQFLFEQNMSLQKYYAIYSILMLSYYIFFLVTAYIKLFDILNGASLRMDIVSANMCITLIYTITTIRQLIMKLSSSFRSIIKLIIDKEKYISSMDDEELVRIYNDCARDTREKSKRYIYVLTAITFQYIVRPVLVGPREEKVGNDISIVKPLPLSSWFPFDEQVHYLPAYMWHILDSLIGASFVTYTDIFMFNLIVYPTGQLKMLQHTLRNFENYKRKYKRVHRITDDDLASCLTFVDIIKSHRKIIMYIDKFNETMGTLMLFDFLQSSLQIASIITQLIGNRITLVLFIFVSTFFVGMILRLFLYYYSANEVSLLSQHLTFSVLESNWYEQNKRVKFMMSFFIMRAQKPLKFHIGNFSVMSLESLIAILKTTYSFIMLMYGVK